MIDLMAPLGFVADRMGEWNFTMFILLVFLAGFIVCWLGTIDIRGGR